MSSIKRSRIDASNSGSQTKVIQHSRVTDNIDVSGVGHTVNVTKSSQAAPVDLRLSEGGIDQLCMVIGRWLWSLDRKVSIPLFLIPTLGSVYVVADWIWLQFIANTGVKTAAVVWLMLALVILFLFLNARCAKCGAHFSVRQVRRQKLDATEYQENTVYNILETYRCIACNDETTKTVVE